MYTFLNIQQEFSNTHQSDEVKSRIDSIKSMPLMRRIFMRGLHEQDRVKHATHYPCYSSQAKRYSASQWDNFCNLCWNMPH